MKILLNWESPKISHSTQVKKNALQKDWSHSVEVEKAFRKSPNFYSESPSSELIPPLPLKSSPNSTSSKKNPEKPLFRTEIKNPCYDKH